MLSKKIETKVLESKPLDENFIEAFINRAIQKECYIEVISLVHNVIEIYLQSKIIEFCTHQEDSLNYYTKRRHIFIKDNKINSLLGLTEICFLFNLIDERIYSEIKSFNSKRNSIIHQLLKSSSEKKKKETYKDVKQIARIGREIQLRLSPLQHSQQDIRNIMYFFDNPSHIDQSYYDLFA